MARGHDTANGTDGTSFAAASAAQTRSLISNGSSGVWDFADIKAALIDV
jgi:hypothetical protein